MSTRPGLFTGSLSESPSLSVAKNGVRAFNINQFTSEISKRGFAKPSNFCVQINPPAAVDTGFDIIDFLHTFNIASLNPAARKILAADSQYVGMKAYLPLRILSVNIPGRTLETANHQYYGPARHIPIGMIPGQNIQIEVILGDTMIERQFFLEWQDLFVGSSRRNLGASASEYSSADYHIGYYDGSWGTIDIFQFAEMPGLQGRKRPDRGGFGLLDDLSKSFGFDSSKLTRPFGINLGSKLPPDIEWATRTRLTEAIPYTINNVEMRWVNGDQFAVLTVEFRFREFVEEHANIAQSASVGKSPLRSLVETAQKFIPLASAIRRAGVTNTVRNTFISYQGPAQSLRGIGRSIFG